MTGAEMNGLNGVNGHANGHTGNGHTGNGHTGNGHTGNGHTGNGLHLNGVEKRVNGVTSNGHAPLKMNGNANGLSTVVANGKEVTNGVPALNGHGPENGLRSNGVKRAIPWEEVQKHCTRTDRWIVVEDQVYDITAWARKHPGGSRVISHYSGQDATVAFRAFHNDVNFVRKFMKSIHIGYIQDPKVAEIDTDFVELRKTAQNMGLFTPSVLFYVLQVGHIVMFEVLAYLVMLKFGVGWIPYILSLLCNTIVQAQASWTQHDYGHLSVFSSTRLNNILHQLTMCFIKGAGSDWWKHLHYQHHAKPNVLNKDPDVRLESLFVLGEHMPKKIAETQEKSMPYNWQDKYFFATLPPLLFPVYFQFMVFKHTISRRKWLDLTVMMCFYLRLLVLYGPLVGVFGVVKYFFTLRVMESHWFVWVSQSNHIPMLIEEDKEKPWLQLQLNATCDVQKSAFNDWFTGHLNFQIEHHLFPTMPRHNLYKIAPLVQSLCKKHHIPYTVKPLLTAFADIIRSLKHSGELWQQYYEAYHLTERGEIPSQS